MKNGKKFLNTIIVVIIFLLFRIVGWFGGMVGGNVGLFISNFSFGLLGGCLVAIIANFICKRLNKFEGGKWADCSAMIMGGVLGIIGGVLGWFLGRIIDKKVDNKKDAARNVS